MKVLRINEDLHAKIKYLAEEQRRTINVMAEMLLEQAIDAPIDGTPTVKQGGAENTQAPQVEDVPYMRLGGTPADANVDDLIRDKPQDSPDNELLCCKDEIKPCKHWVWDVASGEGYKNILSGKFMEVE